MKTKMHFTDNYLISPTNLILVNLIGAGGTGSKVLTELMVMNHSLRFAGDDVITEANLGRQRFAPSETGLYKSVALIIASTFLRGKIGKQKLKNLNEIDFINCPEMDATLLILVKLFLLYINLRVIALFPINCLHR